MDLATITSQPEFFSDMAALSMAIAENTDADEVSELLMRATQRMGAEQAAFASFRKDEEAHDSYRFVMACDPAWCLEYEQSACYLDDPWLEYTRSHADPVLAAQIQPRTKRAQEVVDLSRRYGFASAIIVPAQPPLGLTHLGALCVGSPREGYFSAEALAAVAVAAYPLAQRLQAWQISELRRELLRGVNFSEDDLMLLRHQRDGMGSKEIARATGWSPISVDSKWQRLNAKLGVTSRAVAARMAAEYGLI